VDEEHILAKVEAQAQWRKARQAAFLEKLLKLFGFRPAELLSFDEVRRKLRLGHKNYRGVQEIPIEQIRGSVGRYKDFTQTFLPLREEMRSRWERVNAVSFASGAPPIEVYQVGEAYFVVDGNHRVSVARQYGTPTIQAHVWEFTTPVGLSGEANLDEVLLKAEYADFLEITHLDQLRPEQRIEFSAPGRYHEITDQIALYRQALEQIDGEAISQEEAVTAWYDMVYSPAAQMIQQAGVLEHFPERTEADLFIWVWRYNEELRQRQKKPSLAEALSRLMTIGQSGIWERFKDFVTGSSRSDPER
jgi:hypothetical protein